MSVAEFLGGQIYLMDFLADLGYFLFGFSFRPFVHPKSQELRAIV
jgi:hypothetical protein